MKKYNAYFSNRHIAEYTEVQDYSLDENSTNFLLLRMKGVEIDIDGFELLSIDQPEIYETEQINLFDFDISYPYENKQKGLLLLKDFHFETFIPINVFNKKTKERHSEQLKIQINCTADRIYQYAFSLLSAVSCKGDIDDALVEIQSQLKESYNVEICACCKNACWNPYGGVPFFNHLCFKQDKDIFRTIEKKDKNTLSRLMNELKWTRVNVVHCCDEYTASVL